MGGERVWAAVWVTAFLPALVGVCAVAVPAVPAAQIAVAPAWVAWWALAAGPRLGAWAAIWGGALLEWAWGVPPGACVGFFLALWGAGRLWRSALPKPLRPLHGLIGGMVGAPLLRLWLWLWALPWLGVGGAAPLRPDVAGLAATPALGALGGCAIFALARAWEFRALAPRGEEAQDAG